MNDNNQVLSYEEVIHYGSTADVRLHLDRTPGLKPFSSQEKTIGFFALLIFSAIFYVHIDVYPFLPVDLSSRLTSFLGLVSFLGLGFCAFITMAFLLKLSWAVIDSFSALRKMRTPKVTCTKCGKVNKLSDYVDGKQCEKCQSDTVYCGDCGMSVSFSKIKSGIGCEKCAAKTVSVRY